MHRAPSRLGRWILRTQPAWPVDAEDTQPAWPVDAEAVVLASSFGPIWVCPDAVTNDIPVSAVEKTPR
eukprot:8515269-Pyramimonas_sp.AAC.1